MCDCSRWNPGYRAFRYQRGYTGPVVIPPFRRGQLLFDEPAHWECRETGEECCEDGCPNGPEYFEEHGEDYEQDDPRETQMMYDEDWKYDD